MQTDTRELTIPFSKGAYVYLMPSDGYSQVGLWLEDKQEWGKLEGRVLIKVPDNKDVDAALDQMNQARTLGYPTVEQMVCEHDLLHMWLAYNRGLPYSPVVYHTISNTPADPAELAMEEADVLGLTYYINRNSWNDRWGLGRIPAHERVQYRERALDFLVGIGLRVWQ